MNTVLTLDIDQEVIKKAENYAKSSRKTISQLVEDYLITISSEKKEKPIQLGPITSQIAGIIEMDGNVNYKDLLTDALLEKHL